MVDAKEDGGKTTLQFYRKRVTNDADDLSFEVKHLTIVSETFPEVLLSHKVNIHTFYRFLGIK